MANTYVDYTATAGQTDFNFSFPYLENDHVEVFIDGVESTAFTISLSPTRVVLDTAATGGETVRVRRSSDPTEDLVDFVNGSILTESDLDRAYLHNRYLNEEAYEGNTASLQTASGSTNFDANFNKIINLSPPTNSLDAANKDYVDDKLALSGTSLSGFNKSTHTGDNATTTFTLSFTPQTGTASAFRVAIDGVLQTPDDAYTVNTSTNQITFTSAPPTNAEIVVIATGTAQDVNSIGVTATGSTTARTLADRFADEVNVRDFGAVGNGTTDDTTAWEAARDYVLADPFNRVFVAPAGQHSLPNGINLYGVVYCRIEGNIVASDATKEVVIGGNVVEADPCKLMFHSGNCTLKVDGISRSHIEFTRFNELHLFSSNSGENTKYNVSYSNFYFTEVVDFRMETNTTSGTTAWMNENKFFGGRITNSLVMTGDYPMNNNSFYGFKLESIGITIDANNGSTGAHHNMFHDARLEGSMNFTFGQYTFNNLFFQTWSNFANTMIWDLPAQVYTITDNGDNNRIIPIHYTYTEKEAVTLYDVKHLGNNGVFGISTVNPEKISVIQNGGTIFDSGLIPVTDKSWFTLKGDADSFHLYLEVYDEDFNPITTEPSSGFKTSQGTTTWDASGFWWYVTPVSGGNFAVNPNADSNVKYIRYWARVDNAALGDEHTSIKSWIAFPQEDKYPAKNLAEDNLKVDILSNKVTATSEATAVDLLKFTAGATATDAVGVLSGQLIISLTGEKSTSETGGSAYCFINVSREESGNISINTSTPTLLTDGGVLDFTGITLATKAGASSSEAILTITIATNQSDPFDSLNARARLTGVRDQNLGYSSLINVEKI
jgi:hypothetical protein